VNALKPHRKTTLTTLLGRGLSQREIERVTGIDRKTIRLYQQRMAGEDSNSSRAATGSDQISPPRPPAFGQTAPPRPPATQTVPSECEPYREFIESQLRLRRNLTAIYQDLVDRYGFTAKYGSVKRFARRLTFHEPEQFDRLEFGPAEEAQVDYGEGAPTLDPATGRYRRPRLFVMTLRYSRRSFRRVVWKSSQQAWADLHAQAFAYFGGTPCYVVLDNLKEGVIKPDLYEPELNTVYAAMLAHYGVVADPARIRDPNRKGSVENAIQHTQNTALKGRRFESLQAQNDHLEHWESNWASKRIHGSAKRQVEAMFEEERTHLRALPLTPFRTFKDLVRTVSDDTSVRVDHSSYAARPAAIGSQVMVRLYERSLEIRDLTSHALLRTHVRSDVPGSVHIPNAERPFNPSRETKSILLQARQIGPATERLCKDLFATEGRVGQRRLWGIVGLARKYPASVVEQACAVALQEGIHSYPQIKQLAHAAFEIAIERLNDAVHQKLDRVQQHNLIRTANDYADLFTRGAEFSAALTTPKEPTA
jgi:transposase